MRKAFFLLLFVPLLFSCEKVDDNPTWSVSNVRIDADHWKYVEDENRNNGCYVCSINFPEITPYVFENGIVNAYIVEDSRQFQLPYTQHNETEGTSGQQILWTRTINYVYQRTTSTQTGSVTFVITDNDFQKDPPGTMDFRVVLMW
jgi:hypothetical protein